MKKRVFTILTCLVFGIAIFLFAIQSPLAIGADCVYIGPGGGGGDGGGGSSGCTKVRHVECNIRVEEIKEEIILEEDVYDTKNNFIGRALLIKDKYRFVAGRFIGIDAYEKYTKTFTVSINPTCVIAYCHLEEHCWWSCGGSVCCSMDEVCVCGSCKVEINECRDEAERKLEELANSVDVNPSFEAKRQDVNDINKGHEGNNPTIDVELSHISVDRGHPEPSDPNSKYVTRTVTMEYTYNLTPAWINPQTGQVKYEPVTKDAITAKEQQDYIKVPEMYTTRLGDTIRIGQYFLPLNAKSTDVLRYYLLPNMQKEALGKELCTSIIQKYSEKDADVEHWSDILADINGVPLKNRASTTDEALGIIKSENGCRLSLNIDYRIAQGFYNEITETKKGIGSGGNGSRNPGIIGNVQTSIKGYNFYYRPIDYKEPFPNGLTENSYWSDVYDEKSNAVTVENASGNKLDLDNSFSQVTYATNADYNLKSIREYNSKEDNKYTSMMKISLGGTSSFISDGHGITRYDCQTFYALGCGPTNSDWEECQTRQTGVCKR